MKITLLLWMVMAWQTNTKTCADRPDTCPPPQVACPTCVFTDHGVTTQFWNRQAQIEKPEPVKIGDCFVVLSPNVLSRALGCIPEGASIQFVMTCGGGSVDDCPKLEPIFLDSHLTIAAPNPIMLDANGDVSFYVGKSGHRVSVHGNMVYVYTEKENHATK